MRPGQSTLEYTVLIVIFVTVFLAMSQYVRRAVQANLKVIEEEINREPQ